MTKEKPMLAQYRKIQKEHPNCIILFGVGGFYNLYEKDAYIASKILGLNVISKNIGAGDIPTCGIPVSSVKKYTGEFVKNGYSVVICDQVEGISEFGDVKNRTVTDKIIPVGGVPIKNPVREDDYDGFISEFKRKQEKKAEKKLATKSDDYKIIEELRGFDLGEMAPNEAWAVLYHWKRTYCKE